MSHKYDKYSDIEYLTYTFIQFWYCKYTVINVSRLNWVDTLSVSHWVFLH